VRFWDPNSEGEGPFQPGTTRYTLRTTFEGQKFQASLDMPTELSSGYAVEYASHELKAHLARSLVEKLEAEGRIEITHHTEPESWF
jgi:hypothetical protein